MADSLEANFALDSDSDEQSGSVGPSKLSSSSSSRRQPDAQGSSSAGSQSVKARGIKRRGSQASDSSDDDGDDGSGGQDVEAMKLAAGAASAQKKARRKARTKARKARIAAVQAEEAAHSSPSSNNPALLPASSQVDYLRKEMRKAPAWKDLSELEMAERGVGEAEVVETMIQWKGARELDDLSAFVKQFVPLPAFEEGAPDRESSQSASERLGAPSLLVLTNNALRAAHIARELRNLLPKAGRSLSVPGRDGAPAAKKARPLKEQTNNTEAQGDEQASKAKGASLQIAKLFSRHFTPAQQVSFLATHPVLAGAGTPQRIALLLSRSRGSAGQPTTKRASTDDDLDAAAATTDEETGGAYALDLSNLTTLVLDAGWKDEKLRCLLDDQGAREGLVEVWDKIRERRKRGQVKVVLF